MDSEEFRRAALSSIDEIVKYYDHISERRVVSTVEPGYLREILPNEAPDKGERWEDIQKDIEAKIMPGITHWQHPSFHAFFPCASSYPSMLGELYSAALSGACFNWICSPAVTELETIVLDWLAKLLGLPATFLSTGPTNGGGVIQGSASEAVLTAMVAAREKYLHEKLPPRPQGQNDDDDVDQEREDALAHLRARMVALGSSMAHSSTRKAAKVLGLRFETIAVTDGHVSSSPPGTSDARGADMTTGKGGYALTGPALLAKLRDCRARGLEPFFLTATLGTTDTCAVDDFSGIAEALAQFRAECREGPGGDGAGEVWVHVDAAYAGTALVCPEVQDAIGVRGTARDTSAQIENETGTPKAANVTARSGVFDTFHSFDTNMHKWLLTHFDASCLYVRDRSWFVRALGVGQAVYHNAASSGGLVTDYREWQIPLGRRFRALKIWFVLRSFGAEGLRAHIRRTARLGALFAELLLSEEAQGMFELLAGPRFALTVFRMAGRGPSRAMAGKGKVEGEETEKNTLTRKLYEKINHSGKVWVTSTVLEGRFAIRFMTGVWKTEEEHVRMAHSLFVDLAREVLAEQPTAN
ncbi:hypothetical protein VTK73DRAFT_9365 [Phialemonium thermophilum]|uniref:Aromatic-L-amino-acid decarboxylase n=1 Tax=Phialemonium thermophilum TaxID=223376 RepID=A0ABR3W2W3_9PEZI